jgi:hypothetical protein
VTGEATNVLDRIERFAGRPAAVATMGLWAAAEAILFPIVPDVGLGLLVLAAPSRALRLFAAVALGAVAGTVVLAALTLQAPDTVRGLLLSLPGINPAVLDGADQALARDGVAGFAQFGPGAPLKVYTVEWLGRGGDIASLLVGAVLNRITRIVPPLIVAAAIGHLARPWLRRHPGATVGVYAAFWLVVYIGYFAGSG